MDNNEAKVPNDLSKWESIDIYLFSNGQQYSPPRKYHLRAEELNWWQSTLNHLARLHYGSLHKSIELYGIDGKKVEGPLQLIDGTYYVAVVPPDAFIDASYEKYLIKASKSWEKSQAKKANGSSIVVKKTGPPQIDSSTEAVVTPELTAIKTPDENADVVVESIIAIPRKSNTPKPDVVETKQPRKSIIGLPKSHSKTERRRSSGAHTAFVKTPSSQIKNNSRKPLTRIPIKVNGQTIGSAIKPKVVSKYKAASPPTSTVPNSLAPIVNTEPVDNLISDRDIIVISTDTHLYKNPESDNKSMKLDAYQIPIADNVIIATVGSIEHVNEEAQTAVEQSTREVNTPDADVLYTDSKLQVAPVTLVERNIAVTCDIPLEDNYIAIINKGDPVNLSMNLGYQTIGIQDAIQTKSNYNVVQNKSSLTDIKTREVSLNSEDGNAVKQTKSLQSVPNDFNKNFAKVIVVQCGCCGNTAAVPHLVTMPVFKTEEDFFILMPSPVKEEIQGCQRSVNNSPQNNKSKTNEIYTESATRIRSPTYFPCVPQGVGLVMTVGSQTDAYKSEAMVTKETACVHEDQCNVVNCTTSYSQTMERTEVITSVTNIRAPVDVSTQTAWCSILLEATRHEDGRYSFHLPPLQVLKCFSLL
ncbi:uncharacterized protein LOC142978327 isoform X2 [Anticarsia gemmatalis]|uniref:uncharacterized protein LOC142978327 isoform X2 n=1 Tax=Anticarsia gemmatalis TaxID=129554 RepID=UPI003F757B43